MAARLTLICHAALARQREIAFPADEPVDPTALAAVPAVGQALGRFDRLATGPELRARQTAEALGPGAVVLPVLRDCDFGSWRGRSLGEIGANDPAAATSWLADVAARPHGGESILDLLGRVGGWLDRDDGRDRVVAVTHPAVVRAAIVQALGAPPQAFWRVDVVPLSVTELRRNAGHWTLRSTGSIL